MKPLGHLAGGYLTTQAALHIIKPPPENRLPLLTLGTIAGILPDLDGVYHIIRTRSLKFGEDFDHHRWISHTFPFYWIPGGLLYLWSKLTGRTMVQQATAVTLAGVTTHLLQDTIGSGTGLMWAWPFSKRMDGICTLNVKGGEAWLEVYNQHPISWVERLTVLAAVGLFLTNLLRRPK
jgi:hypothetical protein